MSLNTLIVDVQGFKDQNNNFIVKELSFANHDYTQSFLIKPPYLFKYLKSEEKKQVKWLERNRGIYWNEGYIDYREFLRIIVPYLENKKIIVKGLEKTKWVKELCASCDVYDIDVENCPNFSVLYEKYCNKKTSFNCVNHTKCCALKNVLCLKKYLKW